MSALERPLSGLRVAPVSQYGRFTDNQPVREPAAAPGEDGNDVPSSLRRDDEARLGRPRGARVIGALAPDSAR